MYSMNQTSRAIVTWEVRMSTRRSQRERFKSDTLIFARN